MLSTADATNSILSMHVIMVDAQVLRAISLAGGVVFLV